MIQPGTILAEMPRESGGVSRHHRRSAANHRNLRSSQAQGSGGDRRSRRRRSKFSAKKNAASGPSSSTANRGSNANTWCRTANASWSTAVTSSKPAKPSSTDRWFRTTSCVSPAKKPFSSTLLHEIQQVYRSQRVEINDKHCEIIIARMLRKVKIETAGDTNLLPGLVMDRFEFRRANQELAKCLKIADAGDSEYSRRPNRAQGSPRADQRRDRSCTVARPAKGKKPAVGDGQHAVAGDHQGRRAVQQLHQCRVVPRNDQGADRSGFGRQSRPLGRPEGKRDSGSPDSGRYRFPHLPRMPKSTTAAKRSRIWPSNPSRRSKRASRCSPKPARPATEKRAKRPRATSRSSRAKPSTACSAAAARTERQRKRTTNSIEKPRHPPRLFLCNHRPLSHT